MKSHEKQIDEVQNSIISHKADKSINICWKLLEKHVFPTCDPAFIWITPGNGQITFKLQSVKMCVHGWTALGMKSFDHSAPKSSLKPMLWLTFLEVDGKYKLIPDVSEKLFEWDRTSIHIQRNSNIFNCNNFSDNCHNCRDTNIFVHDCTKWNTLSKHNKTNLSFVHYLHLNIINRAGFLLSATIQKHFTHSVRLKVDISRF